MTRTYVPWFAALLVVGGVIHAAAVFGAYRSGGILYASAMAGAVPSAYLIWRTVKAVLYTIYFPNG